MTIRIPLVAFNIALNVGKKLTDINDQRLVRAPLKGALYNKQLPYRVIRERFSAPVRFYIGKTRRRARRKSPPGE